MKKSVKRLISFLMCCVVVVSSFGFTLKAEAAQQKGDVNNDGKITMLDARQILRFAAELDKPTTTEKTYSDYDGDGVITSQDAKAVLENSLEIVGGDYRRQLLDLGFPESYVDSLVALHIKHPNWRFTPFVTDVDWASAVAGEHSPHSKQLIEYNTDSEYKCTCASCDGVFHEAGLWVSASEYAVMHYLDPRNFLTEKYIFQFEDTTYSSTQTIEGIESILSTTWMHNAYITYVDANGVTKTYTNASGNKVKYSTAIMNAAKNSGMSCYYLAAKILQEVGGYSASASGVSGEYSPYNGIYNYYSIGAYSGAADGLRWANGYMCVESSKVLYKTASTATKLVTLPANTELYYIGESGDYYKVKATVSGKSYTGFIKKTDASVSTSYGRPWSDPYKSIYYGAKYIYAQFSQYQFTNYLQKFNVNKASGYLYEHEYMGNVEGAACEAANTYYAYSDADILTTAKNFSIPVFNNMTDKPLTFGEYFKAKKISDFRVAASTSTSVTLRWSKLSNATGYRIYKYDTADSKYVKLTDVTTTSYTDTTVKKGDSVKYCIKAFNKYSSDVIYWNTNGAVVSFTVTASSVTGASTATEKCPYTEPTTSLSKGSTGTGVKWLQWYLVKLGYLSSESDIDGDFGANTQSAVKKFQQDNGLTVDGIVGSGTRTALKKEYNS